MDSSFFPRARRGILITLATYVLLVATHQGEFWPFSIFPMFSQAGHPWTRTVIRQVPDHTPDARFWQTVPLEELRGEPVGLEAHGVNPNDVANFVSKTTVWDERRLNSLNRLLDADRVDESLLVYKVRGQLEENTVETTAEPLILFAPDTTFTAPSLNISRPSLQ